MLLLGVLFCHVSTVPAQQHLRVEGALETPTQAATTLAVCVGGTGRTCSLGETGQQATSRRNVSSRARGSQVPAADSSPPSVDRTVSWRALSPSPFGRAQLRARLTHLSPTHSVPRLLEPERQLFHPCRAQREELPVGLQGARLAVCLPVDPGRVPPVSPGVLRKPTSASCAAACPGHSAVPGAGGLQVCGEPHRTQRLRRPATEHCGSGALGQGAVSAPCPGTPTGAGAPFLAAYLHLGSKGSPESRGSSFILERLLPEVVTLVSRMQ